MAIYKCGLGFELGTTKNKSSKWPKWDSTLGTAGLGVPLGHAAAPGKGTRGVGGEGDESEREGGSLTALMKKGVNL